MGEKDESQTMNIIQPKVTKNQVNESSALAVGTNDTHSKSPLE